MGAGQLTEVTGGQRRVIGAGIIGAGARQLIIKNSKDCGICGIIFYIYYESNVSCFTYMYM